MTSALILAAGMGTRLIPLTRDTPKALVEVGGATLLDRLVDSCTSAGMDHVVVVTGCLHDKIEQWAAAAQHKATIELVFNEAFSTLGNAWSVAVAQRALEGKSFVKLDGDLMLEPAIVTSLCRMSGSVCAVDRNADLDEEAMKASIEDGLVTGMGKWLKRSKAHAESIGVERIAKEDAPTVFDALEAIVGASPNAYYEDAYHQLIARGALQLGAYDIGTARWTEIDCAADLKRAQQMFGSLVPRPVV